MDTGMWDLFNDAVSNAKNVVKIQNAGKVLSAKVLRQERHMDYGGKPPANKFRERGI
jgi:hypothetical protein